MISNSHKVKNLLAKPLASLANKGFGLPVIVLSLVGATVLLAPSVSMAQYRPDVIMSMAHNKNVEIGHEFSNQTLTYHTHHSKYTENETASDDVVNSAFGAAGGAGCGISLGLMNAIYPNEVTNGVNSNNNFVALNVYSRALDFDPNAPIDATHVAQHGRPDGGPSKGYLWRLMNEGLSKTLFSRAYPYSVHLRPIPSIYPAYEGLWNNGQQCLRYLNVTVSTTSCGTNDAQLGHSKVCDNAPPDQIKTTPLHAYVRDSCEDPNGFCRDYSAHIDMNQDLPQILNKNYYIKWNFMQNPNYDQNSPIKYKDIWLSWVDQANPGPLFPNVPSYDSAWLNLANLKNGISSLQYNINTKEKPLWIKSHLNASGNDVIFSLNGAGTDGGAQWDLKPLNSLNTQHPEKTDPEYINPQYEIRLFDVNGYPVHNGSIYQFNLRGGKSPKQAAPQTGLPHTGYGEETPSPDDSLSTNDLFYGGMPTQICQTLECKSPITTGPQIGPSLGTGDQQGPAVTRYDSPQGTKKITVTVTWPVELESALQYSHITTPPPIVLMNKDGFSYDGTCTSSQCSYNVPSSTDSVEYHIYANINYSDSNDVELRKLRNISIHSQSFSSTSSSTRYALKSSTVSDPNGYDINTTYTGIAKVHLTLTPTTPPSKPTIIWDQQPKHTINGTTAKITWKAHVQTGTKEKPLSEYKVTVDSQPSSSATSPITVKGKGNHTVSVKAVDNNDQPPLTDTKTDTFTIPTPGPGVKKVDGSSKLSLGSKSITITENNIAEDNRYISNPSVAGEITNVDATKAVMVKLSPDVMTETEEDGISKKSCIANGLHINGIPYPMNPSSQVVEIKSSALTKGGNTKLTVDYICSKSKVAASRPYDGSWVNQPTLSNSYKESPYYNASATMSWFYQVKKGENNPAGYMVSIDKVRQKETIPYVDNAPFIYTVGNISPGPHILTAQPYVTMQDPKSQKWVDTPVGTASNSLSITIPSDNQYVIPRLFFKLAKGGDDNLTAYPQGCMLNSYFNKDAHDTTTDCYIYYTQHNQNGFNDVPPNADFTLKAPTYIGANADSSYSVDQSLLQSPINITPYSGKLRKETTPAPFTPVNLEYVATQPISPMRSLMVLLDPYSDKACLKDNVTVSGGPADLPLTVGDLLQTDLSFGTSVTLTATDTNNPNCIPEFFSSNGGGPSMSTIQPGIRPITVIKLIEKVKVPVTKNKITKNKIK